MLPIILDSLIQCIYCKRVSINIIIIIITNLGISSSIQRINDNFFIFIFNQLFRFLQGLDNKRIWIHKYSPKRVCSRKQVWVRGEWPPPPLPLALSPQFLVFIQHSRPPSWLLCVHDQHHQLSSSLLLV